MSLLPLYDVSNAGCGILLAPSLYQSYSNPCISIYRPFFKTLKWAVSP